MDNLVSNVIKTFTIPDILKGGEIKIAIEAKTNFNFKKAKFKLQDNNP